MLTDLVVDYLRAHPPATAERIAASIGVDVRLVRNVLGRGHRERPKAFYIASYEVGQSKRLARVWALGDAKDAKRTSRFVVLRRQKQLEQQ